MAKITNKEVFVEKMTKLTNLFLYLHEKENHSVNYGVINLFCDENFMLYTKTVDNKTGEETRLYKSGLNIFILFDLLQKIEENGEYKKVEDYFNNKS